MGNFVVLEKHLDAAGEGLDGVVLLGHQGVQVLDWKSNNFEQSLKEAQVIYDFW